MGNLSSCSCQQSECVMMSNISTSLHVCVFVSACGWTDQVGNPPVSGQWDDLKYKSGVIIDTNHTVPENGYVVAWNVYLPPHGTPDGMITQHTLLI